MMIERRANGRGARTPRARITTALLVVLAGGCTPPARPADVIVLASGSELESLDGVTTVHPMSRQVQRYVHSVTLVRDDSAMRPTPYWARRWEWSADRRALRFHLDPTLRWHDGTPATARDMAITLGRARDSIGGSVWRARLADVVADSAEDDSTLVLRFDRAHADVPRFACELPLAPRRRAPLVGAGPFRLVAHRSDGRWLFDRVPDFPRAMGGPARPLRLVVAVVDEPTTKFAGLVAGELDVAGIAPTAAALLAGDRAVRVASYPVTFSTALAFNTQRPPFDDARVRRAVGLGVDRGRVVAAALAGFGTPSAAPIAPGLPNVGPEADSFDPGRASALLDAAGWRPGDDGVRRRGGRVLAVQLLTVGSGDNAVEQLVQADLRALGITVEIRSIELGAFLVAARARRKTFDVLLAGIPGDVVSTQLAAMFASRAAGGALDYTGFHRAVLDDAFERAGAADSAMRAAGWSDVRRIIADSAPAAWLYHARGVQGVARRLRGVTMDLRGELPTVHDWIAGPAQP